MTPTLDSVDINTNLAIDRSRLAADRTLMAWVRTSLSMISFGFTIFKFFQYLSESGVETRRPQGALHMGTFLVVLGTVLLIPAILQYWLYIRGLKKHTSEKFPISITLVVSGLISLLGLLALANLFFQFGPF